MRTLPAAIVFGAAGAGYVMSHEDLLTQISPASWVTYEGAGSVAGEPDVGQLASAAAEQIIAVPGPEQIDFASVFRFDTTPRNITERWVRVSTGLTDARYLGYRVPLVTGPLPGDLAGSLTYYFDSKPKVRRVVFLGTTGDPQPIVEFLSRQFGMRRYDDGNPRVTSYRSRYPYSGSLQVAPAEVIDQRQAATNYRIDLTLER